MDSNNTVIDGFKLGYVSAIADIFNILMDNMDDEVQDKVLTELKLKKYE